MPTLLLVRHGQASFGAADYDALSPLGVRQAHALAAALEPPARLVSGSMVRQRDTAAAFGEPEIDARFDEYDADAILAAHSSTGIRLERDGERTPDVRAFQDLLEQALLGWIAAGEASPARESFPAFAARVSDGLQDALARLGSGETALVSTSGGVVAAACVALWRTPPESFVTFNRVTVNTGVSKLVRGRSGTTLVSFNEHAHLRPSEISYR